MFDVFSVCFTLLMMEIFAKHLCIFYHAVFVYFIYGLWPEISFIIIIITRWLPVPRAC